MEAVRKQRIGHILSLKLLHYIDTTGEKSLCNVPQLTIQSLSSFHCKVTNLSLSDLVTGA